MVKDKDKQKITFLRIIFAGILLGIPAIGGIAYSVVRARYGESIDLSGFIAVIMGIYLIGVYLFWIKYRQKNR